MDHKRKDFILEYPADTFHCIRKFCGIDDAKILDDSITSLKEWARKQEHFVRKDFESKHLEWTLVASKGSIEKAKERLDKYCTGKFLYERLFDFDVNDEINDYCNLVVLPKFSNDFYRVAISKMLKSPKDQNIVLTSFRYAISLMEYIRNHDYLNGTIIILDYLDANIVEHSKTVNISDLRQFISVGVNCFGLSVKEIHIITTSNMVEVMVSLIKQCLNEKLRKRIFVHKSYESLCNFIPKDILPVNYGGPEKSVAILHELWYNVLTSKEHMEYMKEMKSFRTDESRRQLVDFNNQYMGTPGSFRRFIVD